MLNSPIPALFTRPVTVPYSSIVASTTARTAASSVTSAGATSTSPAASATAAATASRSASLRAVTTTFAPSRANRFAIDAPSPRLAPVTMIVSPSSVVITAATVAENLKRPVYHGQFGPQSDGGGPSAH